MFDLATVMVSQGLYIGEDVRGRRPGSRRVKGLAVGIDE